MPAPFDAVLSNRKSKYSQRGSIANMSLRRSPNRPPMSAMPVTAPVSMSMAVTGERRHWKQHGSRYCANERDFANHSVLLVSSDYGG